MNEGSILSFLADNAQEGAAGSFRMVVMNHHRPTSLLPTTQPCLGIRPIFYVVITACLVSMVSGCDSPKLDSPTAAKSEAINKSTEPTVLRPFGIQTARLEIENSAGLPATLYRVESNELVEAQKLDPREHHQSFVVPSGFYSIMVRQEKATDSIKNQQSAIAVPVPAISSILNSRPLKIEIVQPPETQTGWCWIPRGPSVVGDTLGVGAENERPARIENVAAFWLAEAEVTNGQYARFLSAQSTLDRKWIDLESMKCQLKKSAKGTFDSDAPNLPVVMVSFYGAQAYCDWLTEKTKQHHRLPSEIEWEKAARGPNSNTYAYGNTYQQALANQESGKLKTVKSYQPNAYGLYDMTGNVFEWMADQNNPRGDNIYVQSLRGGSFVLDGMYLRNSFRMRQSRTVMTDDIGFRVAKDPN
jgi:formylglycine-generating enzyme required for sulfatase activity